MAAKFLDVGVLQGIARDTSASVSARMIDVFVGHCEQSRDGILTALEGGALPQARRAAHALRSSGLATGAVALTEICLELEQLDELPPPAVCALYRARLMEVCRATLQDLARVRPLFER